ncbi:sulfatase-like hydrolase/transferase [Planctomycetota bacterium]|nr:sulfatase-like hydrolase/transferase [Planctomycetota bacterium]
MNKPNILIFMTDQQRGDTVQSDHPCITPNLDKFREQSITFANTYSPSPHSCPSRTTFFTGLYPSEHGVWHNIDVTNAISRHPHDHIQCWSEQLADAGYQLDFSGKWHVSRKTTPKDHGWNEHYLTATHYEPYNRQQILKEQWQMYQNDSVPISAKHRKHAHINRPGYTAYKHYGHDENPFNDQTVVDSAIKVLQKNTESDKPWCQFIGTLGPHDPYIPPNRFIDMYDIEDIELPENFHDHMLDKPGFYRRTRDIFSQLSEQEHREAILHYYAFCSYEDYLFGQILDTLEQTGQADNTIVIFLSDHGDYCGEHGLWCKGIPCFNSAYHVPAIIRHPKHKQENTTINHFVSLTDFAPTILDFANIQPANESSGQSLLSFFKGNQPDIWRDAHFTQTNGNELYGIQRSIQTENWKYIFNGFDYDELYDIQADPGQTTNLINDPQHKELVKDLCKRIWQFAYEHEDECLNQYIMVGFAPVGPAVVFED